MILIILLLYVVAPFLVLVIGATPLGIAVGKRTGSVLLGAATVVAAAVLGTVAGFLALPLLADSGRNTFTPLMTILGGISALLFAAGTAWLVTSRRKRSEGSGVGGRHSG